MNEKELIAKIIFDAKKKEELSTLDDSFIEEIVKKKLNSNFKLKKFLVNHEQKNVSRSSKYKNLIKKIRAELRDVYGVYATKETKIRKECLKNRDYNTILKSHLSTKERLPIYPSLYKKIWEITGKPKSILDLACGMNPFSLQYMGIKKVKYLATELSKEDCSFLNKFFRQENINGKAKAVNLLEINEKNIFEKFPEFDVAFLFKFLDNSIIKNRRTAELLLKRIPARWIVVSFPTKTIGQKEMKNANREWIKKLCEKFGYGVKTLKFEGEIFYIIKKQNNTNSEKT